MARRAATESEAASLLTDQHVGRSLLAASQALRDRRLGVERRRHRAFLGRARLRQGADLLHRHLVALCDQVEDLEAPVGDGGEDRREVVADPVGRRESPKP